VSRYLWDWVRTIKDLHRPESIVVYISGCKPQPHKPVLWDWVRLKVYFLL